MAPYLTQDIVRMIEQSEIDYMTDRMHAIQEKAGNPEGVEVKRFGHAVAFYSEKMPWPMFNTIKGVCTDDIDCIDDMIDYYSARSRKAQFEIVPSQVDNKLLQALSKRGFHQSGFHTSMYGQADDTPDDKDNGVHIKQLTEADFTDYAVIHCRSTGLPDDGIPHVADNNRILYRRPGWKYFMALIDESPAAVGVMYSNRSIASFTFAGTLPTYRNKGCQQALLRRRIREAAADGCDYVVSQAGFLTQSHRNMEKVGMRIGYVRTTWTKSDFQSYI